MKLIDMLDADDSSSFMLIKPNCPPDSKAFAKWDGMIVIKQMGAFLVTHSNVPQIKERSFLPLCGMVTRSEWKDVTNFMPWDK